MHCTAALEMAAVDRRNATIYVGNLLNSANEADLRNIFTQCGHIVGVKVAGDPSQASRFGFVEFADAAMVREFRAHETDSWRA